MFINNTISPMATTVKIWRPTIRNTTSEFKHWAKGEITFQLKRLWESYKKQQMGTSTEFFSCRPNSRVTLSKFNPTTTTKKTFMPVHQPPSISISLFFQLSNPVETLTQCKENSKSTATIIKIRILSNSKLLPSFTLFCCTVCFQRFLNLCIPLVHSRSTTPNREAVNI